MIDPKFGPGDYITNRYAGDIAIVDSITKKGYYHFKAYLRGFSGELKDVKNKLNDLQINYQKFWDLCTEDEKRKLDETIKNKKEAD